MYFIISNIVLSSFQKNENISNIVSPERSSSLNLLQSNQNRSFNYPNLN